MDLVLPFGSAISCTIFEDIATLIHWIFEQRTSICFIHYLDDYLWVHKHFIVCLRAGQVVKQVVQEVGLPLAEDKFFGPAQVLDFLGLTIDSIRMAVAIPSNKATSILKDIQVVMGSKKCHIKQLQALAGRLNFITKAVPHGRPFSRRIYDMFAGMKPHWHMSITTELHKDLQMRSRFIQEYGGWTPILLPETPILHLFTDAATMETLGWGAWWGTVWAWDTWDPVFMCSSTLSIDFLELFAVVVVVWIWSPQFANKHVVVHSDNQPTVAVVNSKMSKSKSMLVLLRFLTLHCMLNNITITTSFVPGSANQVADALSCLQFSRFHQLMPLADPLPMTLPTFLSPLSQRTFANLQL